MRVRVAVLVLTAAAASTSGPAWADGPDMSWLKADNKAVRYSNEYRQLASEILKPATPASRDSATDRMYQMAREGYADAINFVGYMLDNGVGVRRDPANAAVYFREAAARGNRYALHNLGLSFLVGRGVPQNSDTGLKLLQEAAKYRIPESSIVMAMYFETRKEWNRAFMGYEAAKGFVDHPIAKNRLGVLMVRGFQGVQQNIKEGRTLIEDAANVWWPEAQYTLAVMAQEGIGGKPDAWGAGYWFTILSQNPNAKGTQYERMAGARNSIGLSEQAWKEIDGSSKQWIAAHQRVSEVRDYWLSVPGPIT